MNIKKGKGDMDLTQPVCAPGATQVDGKCSCAVLECSRRFGKHKHTQKDSLHRWAHQTDFLNKTLVQLSPKSDTWVA